MAGYDPLGAPASGDKFTCTDADGYAVDIVEAVRDALPPEKRKMRLVMYAYCPIAKKLVVEWEGDYQL